MAMRVDTYSRMIAWLKVILPLAALGLLSTLFLLSRSINPTSTIPFADTEIEERLRTQQITGPKFSGTTDAGDKVSITASVVRPASGETRHPEAEDLRAKIDLTKGGQITLRSNFGELTPAGDIVVFRDAVVITDSQGLEVHTEHLHALLSRIEAETEGAVTATGPIGTLDAGRMQLTSDADGQNVRMVFTNGVKLIYDPKQRKDNP